VYDNQSRSMLDTPQRYPRAGSQTYPSPAAETSADGSTTIYFAPTQPQGVARGNWIQTTPGKGWFTILRLYSPLETFFTKQWRPGEIEEVAATTGRRLRVASRQRLMLNLSDVRFWPKDGVIGLAFLWIAEDFGCCASG
jgi:hypothetical protein